MCPLAPTSYFTAAIAVTSEDQNVPSSRSSSNAIIAPALFFADVGSTQEFSIKTMLALAGLTLFALFF